MFTVYSPTSPSWTCTPPSFGAGLWWAIVTLGTVGYGDIVPTTAWGRVLGGFVIVVGVTFLSFLTATVTSYFVSVDQEAEQAKERALRTASDNETRELLRQLDARLAAIENALTYRASRPTSSSAASSGACP